MFPAAGYTDIVTNDSYVGGHVRQYGNLSFSRIFDAGHMVPSDQAETAFVVFSRIIAGDDIGTGRHVNLSTFSTRGPAHSAHKNKVPLQPESTCWIRDIDSTCTDPEKAQIRRGKGVVEHGKWFAQSPSHSPLPIAGIFDPNSGGMSGKGRPTTTSSIPWPGASTATSAPTPTSGASRVAAFFPQRKHDPEFAPYSTPYAGPIDPHGLLHQTSDMASAVKRGLIGGLAAAGGLLLL